MTPSRTVEREMILDGPQKMICPKEQWEKIQNDENKNLPSCCSIGAENCPLSNNFEGFTSKVEERLRVRNDATLAGFVSDVAEARLAYSTSLMAAEAVRVHQFEMLPLAEFVKKQKFPSKCCNDPDPYIITLTCPKDMVFEYMDKNSMIVEVTMQCNLANTESTKLNALQQQENGTTSSEMWFTYELEWKIKYGEVEEAYDDQKHPLCKRKGTQEDNYVLKQQEEPIEESGEPIQDAVSRFMDSVRRFHKNIDTSVDMDDSTGNLLSRNKSAVDILSRIDAWDLVIQEPSCAWHCRQQGFTSMSDPSCSFCLWGGVAGYPRYNNHFPRQVITTDSQESLRRTGEMQLEPNTDFLVEFDMLRLVKTRTTSEDLRFIESAAVSTIADMTAAAAAAAAGVGAGDFQDLGKCKGNGDSGCTFFRCDSRRVFINSGTTGIVYYEVIFSDTINPVDRKKPCRCKGHVEDEDHECFEPGKYDDCDGLFDLHAHKCKPVVAAGLLSFTKVNMRLPA